mgnify:FL=1
MVETDDLSMIVRALVKQTGYIPSNCTARDAFIVTFEHPLTGQFFFAAPEYLERKAVFEAMREESKNYIDFKYFQNDSWAVIFKKYCNFKLGCLPLSYYSPDYETILRDYPVSAFVARVQDSNEEVQSFDFCKAYSHILMTNECDYNVMSVFDQIEPFDQKELVAGEYYLPHNIKMRDIVVARGFWPKVLVQYLVDQKYISLEEIPYVIKASHVLPADQFKAITEEIYEKFPQSAKKCINPGTGLWGQQTKKTSEVAVTDSWEVATAMALEDEHIKLTEINNTMWFIRKKTSERLMKGHCPLLRHVVASSYILLDQMQKEICDEHTKIIAFNTDSIKLVRPRPDFKPTKKEEAKPGDIVLESKVNIRGKFIDELPERPIYTYYEPYWTNLHPAELTMNLQSCMIDGPAGAGKSYLLKQLHNSIKEAKLKVATLTYTNTAALNIKEAEGQTFDSFFPQESTFAQWVEKGSKLDVIMVDEFMIVPSKFYNILYAIKRANPSIKMLFFGGLNQLRSGEYDTAGQIWYLYHQTKLLHMLSDGNRITLQYRAESGRYTQELFDELQQFEETQVLSQMWENTKLFTPETCNFSIVQKPATRERINQIWFNFHRPGKKTIIIQVKKYKALELWVGQPLISYVTDKKSGIINSTAYTVNSIGDMIELLDNETKKVVKITHKVIAKTMRYGWADTVMRIISRSLPNKFNVYDVKHMTWNEFYVCLSRATCKEDIGFLYSLVAEKKFEFHSPPEKGQLLQTKPKALETGYIYRLTDGQQEYIGSTMQTLEERKAQHFDNPTSKKMADWIAENGNNIEIELVDEVLLHEEKQLTKLEYMWIAKMNPNTSMNTKGKHTMAKQETSTKYNVKVEVDYSRFKIRDDENSKRYDIAYRDENGKFVRKRFSYAKKSKENALKEAEAHRAELIKRYFM